MNKGVVIGVILVIIIVGIIGVTSLNFEASDNSVVEDIVETESISIEEIVETESIPIEEIISEPEKEGRDLSVELTESVGLKSP